jgi:hypothetical protein
MVIRVAVRDVESAKRLVVEFVGLFGGECVSLWANGEVQLQPHEDSNRALAQTLDAVEHWLDETRIGSADVWVDERPYRVDRPRSLHQVARSKHCLFTATRAEAAIDAVRQTPDRSSAAGIGSRTTTVERRERWRGSWL